MEQGVDGAILNTTIIPYRVDEVLNHQGTCNYTHGHTKLHSSAYCQHDL